MLSLSTPPMSPSPHQVLRIDLAADVGAPRVRVFGGSLPEGMSREKATQVVTEALKSVADHAAKKGVIVYLETHDGWCHPDDVAEVMKGVAHPAIAVNWDIAHPVNNENVSIDESFQTLKPWIKHVHFHDTGTKEDKERGLVPIGTGDIDHRRAVELLKGVNYEDFLSGEWIGWEPYEKHLPRELATMKGYETNPEPTA